MLLYLLPCGSCGLGGLLDVLCLAGCLRFLCPCVEWGALSAVCALLAGALLAPPALLFWGAVPANPVVILPGVLAGSTVFAVAVHDALPRAAARGCCTRAAARVERYRYAGCPRSVVYAVHAAVGLVSISVLLASTARGAWVSSSLGGSGYAGLGGGFGASYWGFVGYVFISLCAGFALLAVAALAGVIATCFPPDPSSRRQLEEDDGATAARRPVSGAGAQPPPAGPYLAPTPPPPSPAAVGGGVPYATPVVLVAAPQPTASGGSVSPFHDPTRYYAQPVSMGAAVFGAAGGDTHDPYGQRQYVTSAGHAGFGGGPQFGANPFK
jgi:hypothetical protein